MIIMVSGEVPDSTLVVAKSRKGIHEEMLV